MIDTKVVDRYLNKYPTLELILQGGIVSQKMTREILDIDRWLMQDLYKALLLAGAVKGIASGCFRATEEYLAYTERRNIQKCT